MKRNYFLIGLTLIVCICLSLVFVACNKKECEHEWQNTTILKQATCTEDGLQEQKCSKCDEVQGVVIPVQGHAFSEQWEKDEASHWHTCTNDGCSEVSEKADHASADNAHNCTICGDKLSDCADSDKNHKCDICSSVLSSCSDTDKNHKCDLCDTALSDCKSNATYTEKKDSTCLETGYEEYWTCSICGKKYSNADCTTEISAPVVIPAKGHSFTAEIVDAKYLESVATCISKASYYKSCEHCGLSSKDTANQATFQSGEKNPDNHTEDVVWASVDADVHQKQYSCCKVYVGESEAHALVDGECTVCHYGCKHTNLEKHDRKEPNCTEGGNIEYYSCLKCGNLFSDNTCETEISIEDTKLNPHGHKCGTWNELVPATCVSTGTKGYKSCSVCSKYFDIDGNEIADIIIAKDPDNHNWADTWTQTEDGHYHFCTRENCGEHDTLVPHKDENSDHICDDCDYVVSTCKENAVHTEKQDSLCGVDGYEEYWTCSICGKKYSNADCTTEITTPVVIPAKVHSFTAEIVDAKYLVSEATCTSKATYYKSCVYCGLSAKDTATKPTFQTGEVNPDNHTEEAVWVAVDTDVHQKQYSCCKVYTGESQDHNLVDATCTICLYGCKHTNATENVYNAPTCTEKGNIKYYNCSKCGKNFSDSECLVEVDSVAINALGHDLGDWIDIVDSTCNDEGTLGHYTCSRCGDNFDISESPLTSLVINPKGHTYGVTSYDWTSIVGENSTTYSCVATHSCTVEGCKADNDGHTQTATATVTSVVTRDRACELVELSTFTATFDSTYTWCTTQTLADKESKPALGHDVDETKWVSDGKNGHYHECKNGCDKKFATTAHTFEDGICSSCSEYNTFGTDGLTFVYLEDTDSYFVARYDGSATEVVIPHYHNDNMNGLKKVTALSSLTASYPGFGNNDTVTSVVISNTVTILGVDVFYNTPSLTSITIPDSVYIIGNDAFTANAWIDEYISSSEDGEIYIGKAFYTYKGDIPENYSLVIKDGTKGIAYGALRNKSNISNITSLSLPDSLVWIGGRSFEYCSGIKSINIGNNVEYIGSMAFMYSGAESLSLGSKIREIGDDALEGSQITTLTIPESVEKLGTYAFAYSSSLQTVVVQGKGMKAMEYAFNGCENLQSITFDFTLEELKEFGNSWYCNCSKLVVTYSGGSFKAHYDAVAPTCTEEGAVEYWYNYIDGNKYSNKYFRDDSLLDSITVNSIGHSVEQVWVTNDASGHYYKCSREGCDYIENKSAHTFENGVCTTCSGYNVFTTEGLTFTYDSQSSSYTLQSYTGDAVEVVIPYFYNDGTNGLKPVTKIGDDVFSGNRDITNVVIPDSIRIIGDRAFQGAGRIDSFNMPDTIEYIGKKAFEDVKWLDEMVTSSDGVAYIGKVAVGHSNFFYDGTITIKEGTVSVMPSAFNYEFFTELVLPSSLKHIGEYSFSGALSLESVTFNGGVETIDSYAFRNTSIVSIVIPSTIKAGGMGEGVFNSSFDMVSMTYSGTMAQFKALFGTNEFVGTCFKDEFEIITSDVTFKPYHKANSATCEEDGNYKYYENVLNGKKYTQYGYLADFLIEDVTIDAIGHDSSGSWHYDKDGHWKICGRTSCGDQISYETHTFTNGVCPICEGKENFGYSDYTYTYNESTLTYTITGYTGSATQLVMSYYGNDGSHGDRIISGIGAGAFNGTTVKSLVLPKGLTTIAEEAFANNSTIESITIYGLPDGTIGNKAFNNTSSLTSINYLGGSVTEFVACIADGAIIHAGCNNNLVISGTGNTEFKPHTARVEPTCVAIGNKEYWKDIKSGNCYLASEMTTAVELSETVIDALGHNFVNGICNRTGCTVYNTFGTEGLTYTYDETSESYTVSGYNGSADEVVIPYFHGSESLKPVTAIANEAFKGSTITSIVMADSVVKIGDKAFYDITTLSTATIPDSVEYVGLQAFGNTSWYTTLLTTLDDGVVYIGKSAYSYKGTLPADLTFADDTKSISPSAFKDNSIIETVIIPLSVTIIGNEAFAYNSKLKSVLIGNGVIEIGKSAFSCAGTGYSAEELDEFSLTIGNSVQIISADAFVQVNRLKLLLIPDSVKYIGETAFMNCSDLEVVMIGSGLQSIGYGAFCGTGDPTKSTALSITIVLPLADVKAATQEGKNPMYLNNVWFNCTTQGLEIKGTDFTVKPYTAAKASTCTETGNIEYWYDFCEETYYTDCYYQTDPIINTSDLVVELLSHTFVNGICSECDTYNTIGTDGLVFTYDEGTSSYTVSGLSYSAIGNIDLVIPYYHNDGTNGLKKVTAIGKYAFNSYVSRIVSVVIPDSVEIIGNYVFKNATNLTSVTFPDSVYSVGEDAFNNVPWIATIIEEQEEDGVVYIGKVAYTYKGTVPESVTIADGTLGIAYNAFNGESTLKTINLPTSLLWIDAKAFYMTGITSLTIPDNVKYIGNFAFFYSDYLTSLTLGTNLEIIEENAFTYMRATTLIIPESVKRIGEYAFAGTKLQTIEIEGSGLEQIGELAFYNNSDLTSITFERSLDDLKTISNNTLWYQETPKLTVSYTGGLFKVHYDAIPATCTATGQVEYWYNFLDGKNYSDNRLTTEIEDGIVASALGHNFVEGICNRDGCGVKNTFGTEGITYDYSSGGYYFVTGYTGTDPNLVIPYFYDDGTNGEKYIKYIKEEAIKENTTITSVEISDSVEEIRYRAFSGCTNLATISFSEKTLLFGSATFYNTTWWSQQEDGPVYLNNVVLGFKGIPTSTPIDIVEGTRVICDGCFSGQTAITAISLPSSIVAIGRGAFGTTWKLTTITYDGTYEQLKEATVEGDYIWYAGAEKELSIVCTDKTFSPYHPAVAPTCTTEGSVEYWYNIKTDKKCSDNRASYPISGTGIISALGHTVDEDVWEKDYKDGHYHLCTREGCNEKIGLVEHTFVNGICTVCDTCNTFGSAGVQYNYSSSSDSYGVSRLNSSAPEVVEVAAYYNGSRGLKPVTYIDGAAGQSDCLAKKVILPDTITNIYYRAFNEMPNLEEVVIPESVISIADSAFNLEEDSIWYSNLPDGIIYLGSVAFGYKGTFTGDSLVIREGIKSITTEAFKDIVVQSITLPESLVKIGNNAFENNTALTSITIHGNVTSLGGCLFKNCTSLDSVTFELTLQELKDACFTGNIWNSGLRRMNLTVYYEGGSYNPYVPGISPTCETDGRYAYWLNIKTGEKNYGSDYHSSWYATDEELVIPALGHNYVNGVCNREGCGDKCDSGTEGLTYTYDSTSDSYTISGYNGSSTEIIIPYFHNDGTNGEKKISAIDENAFSSANITAIYNYSEVVIDDTTKTTYGIGEDVTINNR